jgi:hypothetical protein
VQESDPNTQHSKYGNFSETLISLSSLAVIAVVITIISSSDDVTSAKKNEINNPAHVATTNKEITQKNESHKALKKAKISS